MPWELRIHHLDIGSAGDATVIVARFPPGGPGPAITRSVLIDGGKVGSADTVDDYLENVLGLPQVDVIVVTHFDEDHFYGISRLLQTPAPIYDDAIVYDPGRLPEDRDEDSRIDQYGKRVYDRSEYADYWDAVADPNANRVHATRQVNSFDIVRYDPANDYAAVIPRGVLTARIPHGAPQRQYLEPHWLIDKDVMWGNGGDGLGAHPAWAVTPAPAYAPGRPTMTCVTANKYVQQPDGTLRFCSNAARIVGMGQDDVAETENANDKIGRAHV